MKQMRIFTLIIASAFVAVTSCKDESLVLVPEWETAVHGDAVITSANTDFMYNDSSVPLTFDLEWISVDEKLTVTKMEVFVLFNENYVDVDGNPAVAAHGGTTGRSIQVIEGGAVPANRTPISVSITQAALYTLYQDATFDYGNGPVNVFTNPDNPNRDATHRFMWDDKMKVRWEYTTDDGRVFEKWGVSVCTEFPNAACAIDFTVVCATVIPNAAGTWVFDLVDTYGDGWQGGYISVLVDGVEADRIFLLSQYDPGGVPVSSGQDTFTGTAGTILSFAWSNDDYNSEVEFTITSPSGNVVADIATPTAGPIKLDLCLE